MKALKVGDLVKTLIGDIDEGGVTEAGEAGLVTEIELMFGSNNKLYSVKFNDGQVIPYYRCDLKVLSNA